EARGRDAGEVFRIVNEETRAEVESPVVRVIREGIVVGLANHTALIARDGSERAIADSGAPIREPGGRVAGVVLVFRDVSAERAAQERLRESEERIRLLVDSVKDYAIIMLDPGGRVQTWNRGAERIKGWRADEIIGSHFARFYTADDVAAGKPEAELRVAAAEGRVEDEGWRVRKDGTRFWASVVITAVRDGGELRGFAKVTRDLTERRRAEDELRASQARLAITLHSIGDGVIATDAE